MSRASRSTCAPTKARAGSRSTAPATTSTACTTTSGGTSSTAQTAAVGHRDDVPIPVSSQHRRCSAIDAARCQASTGLDEARHFGCEWPVAPADEHATRSQPGDFPYRESWACEPIGDGAGQERDGPAEFDEPERFGQSGHGRTGGVGKVLSYVFTPLVKTVEVLGQVGPTGDGLGEEVGGLEVAGACERVVDGQHTDAGLSPQLD